MDFSEKVSALAKARNISINALRHEICVGNGTLQAHGDPRLSTVIKVANYFNVPLEYFCDEEFNIDSDEQTLLSIYGSFNDEGREKLLNYARDLHDTGRYIKNHKHKMVENDA